MSELILVVFFIDIIMNIEIDSIPEVAPTFRVQWEEVQDCWVVLYPEGMVKLSQSALSQHLSKLRQANIVDTRRDRPGPGRARLRPGGALPGASRRGGRGGRRGGLHDAGAVRTGRCPQLGSRAP